MRPERGYWICVRKIILKDNIHSGLEEQILTACRYFKCLSSRFETRFLDSNMVHLLGEYQTDHHLLVGEASIRYESSPWKCQDGATTVVRYEILEVNCRRGKLSYGRTILSANCPVDELIFGEL